MMRGKTHVIRGTKSRPLSEGHLCSYSHRTCMLNRLDGFEFCLKHILEDKTAPYKQCSFVSSRKAKRCPNAASKVDRKDNYCLEHTRKASLLRQKSSMKKRPKETSESLLEELASSNNPVASAETGPPVKRSRLPSDSIISKVLDYATSSDSEIEAPQIDESWRGDGDSDAESIDSEQEDVLKHAGVYTAEEVALILRDKLIRLQSLYIDQFKRLQHVMKEKRRKYLHTYKHDREMFGSIKVYKKDPTQSRKYEKLKALKKYHKRCGKEALLHRQSKERRIAVSEGPNYKPPSYPKCCYIDDDSVKCCERTIPLSKFCAEHILHDPRQVFFHPCSFAKGNCGRPVAGYADPPFCSLHFSLFDAELRLHNLGNVCTDPNPLDVEVIKREPELPRHEVEVKEENEAADVDVGSPAASHNIGVSDKEMLFEKADKQNTSSIVPSASRSSVTPGPSSSGVQPSASESSLTPGAKLSASKISLQGATSSASGSSIQGAMTSESGISFTSGESSSFSSTSLTSVAPSSSESSMTLASVSGTSLSSGAPSSFSATSLKPDALLSGVQSSASETFSTEESSSSATSLRPGGTSSTTSSGVTAPVCEDSSTPDSSSGPTLASGIQVPRSEKSSGMPIPSSEASVSNGDKPTELSVASDKSIPNRDNNELMDTA